MLRGKELVRTFQAKTCENGIVSPKFRGKNLTGGNNKVNCKLNGKSLTVENGNVKVN